MKFNKNNTCLHFLEPGAGKNLWFGFPELNKDISENNLQTIGHQIQRSWDQQSIDFNKKIQVLSYPFYQAFCKARKSIAQLYDKAPIRASGTMILPSPGFSNNYFYYVDVDFSVPDYPMEILFYCFSKRSINEHPLLDVFILEGTGEHAELFSGGFIWKGHVDCGFDTTYWIAELIGLLTFMKYAEVETKIVNGNSRGHHVGTKYVNETKTNVEIVDSTWFTTIIRSDEFKVGGHFRLQPYKNEKKLIWISDYMKHGYTRKAKIER